MAFIRVMFVGHGPSNLPEDRIVNTFHFATAGTYSTDLSTTVGLVESFYNDDAPTSSIGKYLSPWVQRDAELRAYDMDEDEPRVPFVTPITLDSVLSTSGLPEEVAVCLSYHGVTPPAITGRRRGRIYIGPLNLNCIDMATAALPSRPNSGFMASLGYAAERLSVAGTGWSIRSTIPGESWTLINDGYVDNAFDTQRRRGPRTTDRMLWGP